MKRNFFIAILSLLLLTSGCASKTDSVYNPGTYQATVDGYGGEITVEVEFNETEILDICITEQSETPGLGEPAAETMADQIKEQQTIDVDVVSSATITSEAVKQAVNDCIEQARQKG